MFEYIFKLIIIGNNSVGKSSIVKAFNGDYFDRQYHFGDLISLISSY